MISLANLFGSSGGGNTYGSGRTGGPSYGPMPVLSGMTGGQGGGQDTPPHPAFSAAPQPAQSLSFLQQILQQLYGGDPVQQQTPWSPVRSTGGGLFSSSTPVTSTPPPPVYYGGSQMGGSRGYGI